MALGKLITLYLSLLVHKMGILSWLISAGFWEAVGFELWFADLPPWSPPQGGKTASAESPQSPEAPLSALEGFEVLSSEQGTFSVPGTGHFLP